MPVRNNHKILMVFFSIDKIDNNKNHIKINKVAIVYKSKTVKLIINLGKYPTSL